MEMDSLIEAFKKDCRVRGMTKRSIESYCTCIKAYQDYLSGHNKDFLTSSKADLVDFIEFLRLDKSLSIMTIKRYLAALSSLWEYLIFKDMVSANYIRGVRARYVRRYKEDSEERKLISIEDMPTVNTDLDKGARERRGQRERGIPPPKLPKQLLKGLKKMSLKLQ